MSKQYVCVEDFTISVYDDDGFLIENEYSEIEKGSVWKVTNNNVIGGYIHLQDLERPWHWLELTKEHFEKFFREEE